MKKSVVASFMAVLVLFCLFSIIKFATEIGSEQEIAKLAEYAFDDRKVMKVLDHLVSDNINRSYTASLRYPYIAALLAHDRTNATAGWKFSCFGSVIRINWIVTAAHCRIPDYSHRALLFFNYIRKNTHSHLIDRWIVHPGYQPNSTVPWHDIALARSNETLEPVISERPFALDQEVHAGVWKTIMTMNRQTYLTNDLAIYDAQLTDPNRCYGLYGFTLDNTLLCVDMSSYSDCFVSEFGPIFSASERVLGVLRMHPKDCDMQIAVFTNVTAYVDWIMENTMPY